MTALRVLEIFDSLQGEGYWTGVPMTFVRLAGCNAPELGLGCTQWCDTPGSWGAHGGEELDVEDIVGRVHLPRLCITGGEPLLQAAGVAALLAEAQRREIRVHIETNGTLDPPAGAPHGGSDVHTQAAPPPGGANDLPRFDWAVVSPKPPHYVIAPGWDGLVDELKLIVDDRLDAATAERLAASHPEAFVSIQPVWEEAPSAAAPGPETGHGGASVERAVALVMAHPDWRLSLQTHKFLGIR